MSQYKKKLKKIFLTMVIVYPLLNDDDHITTLVAFDDRYIVVK